MSTVLPRFNKEHSPYRDSHDDQETAGLTGTQERRSTLQNRCLVNRGLIRVAVMVALFIGLLMLLGSSSSAHEVTTRLLAPPQRASIFQDLAAPEKPKSMFNQIKTSAKQPERVPKIIKLTFAFGKGTIDPAGAAKGMDDVRARSVALHVKHAKKNGYRQYLQTNDIMGNIMTKHATVQSILLEELQRPEAERAEWVVMHDVDMVNYNMNMPLETFLPPADRTDIHLMATRDGNGFNSGAIYWRVSSINVETISGNMFYQYIPGRRDWKYAEQGMLSNVLEDYPRFNATAVIVPKHWINAYPPGWEGGFQPGNWILHTVAWAKAKLPEFVADAEKELPENNISPEESGLTEEVREFWATYPKKQQ